MTRPAVVFHAVASHAAGFGHVARLCAIIEQVEACGVQPIVMFNGDATLARWLAHHDIRAEVRAWTTVELLAASALPHVRATVIDGPALADALVPMLAVRGSRTVVIDDRGDSTLPVDAVINHNFHAPALIATYPSARVRLLGRKYLMLRREIRRYAHGSCRPRTTARLRVVVTFGGSDPVGATARTLRLMPDDRPVDLLAIAGPGFRDDGELIAAAHIASAAGHSVEIVRDPDDPAGLFIAADAAICSAGGTLGELAYLGCPALGFAIVSDQLEPARAQATSGLIAGGQQWSALDDASLRAQLRGFLTDDNRRLDHRQRALATADAAGPRRIVAEALT